MLIKIELLSKSMKSQKGGWREWKHLLDAMCIYLVNWDIITDIDCILELEEKEEASVAAKTIENRLDDEKVYFF